VGVTAGENVATALVRKLPSEEKVQLARLQLPCNIDWEQEEIAWKDGVQPVFEVLIKPMEVGGGGLLHKPGSNRISGDGPPLDAMIQAAWQTDWWDIDYRDELPAGQYRFAAAVPKGREAELLPVLQDALERSFGFRARWDERERDVLVLSRDGTAPLKESGCEEWWWMRQG
jgi:hypothetical protein